MSQRSGLLEWCEGTVPMGDYLIAPGRGAHEKYRPQDLRAKDCRGALNVRTNRGWASDGRVTQNINWLEYDKFGRILTEMI